MHQVERELQQIKDRLLLTESQLDNERHARNERDERVTNNHNSMLHCTMLTPLQTLYGLYAQFRNVLLQEHERDLARLDDKQRDWERMREEDEHRHEVHTQHLCLNVLFYTGQFLIT